MATSTSATTSTSASTASTASTVSLTAAAGGSDALGVGLVCLQKQRPWRPPAEPPKSEWGPWWLEAAFGISLVAAMFVLIRAFGDDYLGECSFQTGYEPEVGFMGIAPALLLLVGVGEMLVAFSVRVDRANHRFVAGGLFVCALSVISFLEVMSNIGRHLCD